MLKKTKVLINLVYVKRRRILLWLACLYKNFALIYFKYYLIQTADRLSSLYIHSIDRFKLLMSNYDISSFSLVNCRIDITVWSCDDQSIQKYIL